MEVLTARWLIPIAREPIENAGVVIKNGKIISVGKKKELKKEYNLKNSLEYEILFPGLVNAHTHLELGFEKPLPFKKDMVNWIIKLTETKWNMDDRMMLSSIRDGIMESISYGVTALGDIVSRSGIIPAHREFGLHSTVYREVVGISDKFTDEIMDVIKRDISGSSFEGMTYKLGISAHSPYTVSYKLYKLLSDYAQNNNLVFNTHLAESDAELEFIEQGRGPLLEEYYPFLSWEKYKQKPKWCSPVKYLEEIIGPGITLIHSVKVSNRDLEIIRKARAVVHCPRSNLYLKNGLAPVPEMLRMGIPVALGTDSRASVPDLNLWNEIKTVYLNRKNYQGGELSALDIIRMATINSAIAISREKEIGTIEEGKFADIISFELKDKAKNKNELVQKIVEQAGSFKIKMVMVAGRRVFDNFKISRQ